MLTSLVGTGSGNSDVSQVVVVALLANGWHGSAGMNTLVQFDRLYVRGFSSKFLSAIRKLT